MSLNIGDIVVYAPTNMRQGLKQDPVKGIIKSICPKYKWVSIEVLGRSKKKICVNPKFISGPM